jgi:hypothetical protein
MGIGENIVIDTEMTAERDQQVVEKETTMIIDLVNGIAATTDTGRTIDTGREVQTKSQTTDPVSILSNESTTTPGGIVHHHYPVVVHL